ncbi:MAG: hypothetical protein JWQ98_2459 [Chlorobi bacterium]|nr:hypothetical protein [Chlorobiota bacterium]
MRTYLLPLLLIAIALGFMLQAACAPLYIPPKVQAPLLSNAGEVHVAADADIGRQGYDAQVAWSPYNHFGLYGDFSIAPRESRLPDREAHLRHTYGEGAAGWYTRTDEGTRVELLGGIGLGTTTNLWYQDRGGNSYYGSPTTGTDSQLHVIRGTYKRYFLQANWGRTRPVPDTVTTFSEKGFTMRAGWLQFIHLSDINGNDVPRSTFFLEPAMFIRGGSRLVQVEAQAGSSLVLGQGRYDSYTLYLRLGIHFMFGRGL